jgi:hypothetical protein
MDITSSALSAVGSADAGGGLAQAAQLLVLRKAMQTQESSALALLQALPSPAAASTGSLPLATGGPVGTQVNELA